jgi:basic amino acid/polyamine antiporter, APA family
VPELATWTRAIAVVVTTILAAIQLRGIGLGALIQEIATSLIGLVFFGLAMLLLFAGTPDNVRPSAMPGDNSLKDWSLIIATIIFTYDGWLYVTYFSGEIKGGVGTVARSCIKGMVIVIALYILLNFALVKRVGLTALTGSDLALARAIELAIHPVARTVVIGAAILILRSHQNLEYMSGPRILQALADDGFAATNAQKVGTSGNPIFAILTPWLVSVALLLVGGFEYLLLLAVFFYIPLYLALILGVLILRKRVPDADRPYRAWGHPFSAIVCLIGWTIVTLFQAYAERETVLYAVAMVAMSWPVYQYLSRR